MSSPPTQPKRPTHTTPLPCSAPQSSLTWCLCCVALLALLVLTPASLILATAHAQQPDSAQIGLQRRLDELLREKVTWLQQKQQLLSVLTSSTSLESSPSQHSEPLLVEIAADGQVQPSHQQQQQQAGSGQSAVQLVDVDHLLSFIPAAELATVQSTIHDLLSAHGIDGTIYVSLSRTNPRAAFRPHTTQQLTADDLLVATASSQPAGMHDVVSSESDSVPAAATAAPAPAVQFQPRFPLALPSNDSYPALLLPPPTLPPYSPTTPASTYLPYLRTEFLHAYHAYCRDAWGTDDYMPVTRRGGVSYGMSLTMVDALDTLIVMDEWGEVERAVQWMADNLHFGHQQDVNVFETTIRILGSLLASAHLINTTDTPALPPTSRDALSTILLTHAHTLGSHLLHAFQTPLGIPYGTLSLQTRTMYNPGWSGGASTMAELGSVQLEFQYLSRVTGREEYEEAVDGVMWAVRRMNRSLYGQFMSVDKGEMTSNVVTLGARVDSLYEYFLKQWLLTGKSDERVMMRDMWLESGQAIRDQLLLVAMGDGFVQQYTSDFISNRTAYPANALLFAAERHNEQLQGKMDHLVCFLPGVYALSAYHRTCDSRKSEAARGRSEGGCSDEEWLGIARELARTCVAMYSTETGLAPEIVQFSMRRRADEERQRNERRQLLDEARVAHDRAQLAYNLKRTLIYANTTLPQHDRDHLLQRLDAQHNATLAALPPLDLPPLPPIATQPAFVIDPGAKHNLLRPETMESLFVLWRVTHEHEWREAGWRIFSAFVRYCRVDGGGYTGLHDVSRGEADRQTGRLDWQRRLHEWQLANGREGEGEAGYVFEWSNWKDHMESFWLSETMKYAWLLLSDDDVLPIDQYVFNTEAHPLPVAKEKRRGEAAAYIKRRLAVENEAAKQPGTEQQQQQQHEDAQEQQPVGEQPVIANGLSSGNAASGEGELSIEALSAESDAT